MPHAGSRTSSSGFGWIISTTNGDEVARRTAWVLR